jgi:hypothetical protein
VPGAIHAHTKFANGDWTYKYYTRNDPVKCGGTSGPIDPLTIIVRNYGGYDHASNHFDPETHFGDANIGASDQYVCGCNSSGTLSCPDAQIQVYHKTGKNEFGPVQRAHFRMFPAPHGHSETIDKWTVLDPHHESVSTDAPHDIDEPWGTWENHVLTDQGVCAGYPHGIEFDIYMFNAGQPAQGFPDNGLQSRYGGLHNGSYTAAPSGTCPP